MSLVGRPPRRKQLGLDSLTRRSIKAKRPGAKLGAGCSRQQERLSSSRKSPEQHFNSTKSLGMLSLRQLPCSGRKRAGAEHHCRLDIFVILQGACHDHEQRCQSRVVVGIHIDRFMVLGRMQDTSFSVDKALLSLKRRLPLLAAAYRRACPSSRQLEFLLQPASDLAGLLVVCQPGFTRRSSCCEIKTQNTVPYQLALIASIDLAGQ